jgi:metal-responsive CopG/Arc/MetJ family transcriptional regulator
VTVKTKPHQRYNKVIVSMSIDPDQCEQLDALVTLRRTSRAAIIREAVDFYLAANSPMRHTPRRTDEVAA